MEFDSKATAAAIEKLRAYDTPTVCNVIELFDVRLRSFGFMAASIKADSPSLPPMVGMASTATFRSQHKDPHASDVYSMLDEQISHFPKNVPAVVVIQDMDAAPFSATFGEVMATTYQWAGAAGLVTSGFARDIDQVRSIGFPTFSQGFNCSHSYCRIEQLNVPVTVGGLLIHPGDIIHGDANGVTDIPANIVVHVANLCPKFMEVEDVVLSFLRDPKNKGDVAGWREARKRMGEKYAELKQEALRLAGKQ